MVEAACGEDAEALCFASPALRDDAALVLAVVSRQGQALEWASEALRADWATVREGGREGFDQ